MQLKEDKLVLGMCKLINFTVYKLFSLNLKTKVLNLKCEVRSAKCNILDFALHISHLRR